MALFFRGDRSLPPYLQVLKAMPLFTKLTNQEFVILMQTIHERTYMPEEVVFEEGDEGLGMYVVVEGKILIHRKSMIGRKEIATIEPGMYFGELALLDGSPRSATATAVESTRLLFFFRPEFLDILETHGRLGAKLSLQIALHTANRLRKTVAHQDFV
jgi:CRP/FNR family transcriptional regulator, cyclic AMP receptor protein